METIKQVTVTCPVTLAPIDSITGEPARGDGRKERAGVLREELQPYDISTLAYEGGFRFRRQELDEDLVNPFGVKVTIHGSWTGFTKYQEMQEEEDGPYTFTVVLGETRCESFFICLNGVPDYKFWPACHQAPQNTWIWGPDPSVKCEDRRWLIDGRDDSVPAGTVYQIKFYWGVNTRRISWEQVGAEYAPRSLRYNHRYQVLGSWTSGRKDDMQKMDDGVFEYRAKIGVSGREEFIFCRDGDDQQLIYPAKPNCTSTGLPVRGPDHLGKGKMWAVTGPVGETVRIRLEVTDGQVIVAIASKSMGERVWESFEGWERHTYWLAFQAGPCTQMYRDPEVPGIFKARGQVGRNFSDKFRGFIELFNIIVDEDPNYGFFPEVACASSGECIVWGPCKITENPFMIRGYQVGAGFEVTLDMRAKDRRKIITWSWDTPPMLSFAPEN